MTKINCVNCATINIPVPEGADVVNCPRCGAGHGLTALGCLKVAADAGCDVEDLEPLVYVE